MPSALANEMAADLEADLAEAKADGVSPEEVLGIGYFDPAAFAHSWATARGIVDLEPTPPAPDRRRRVGLAVTAGVSAVVALLGLVALVGGRQRSRSILALGPGPRRLGLRGLAGGPQQFLTLHQGDAIAAVGAALLLVGLLGLAVVLWLWKPWRALEHRPPRDPEIGLPSYL